MGPPATSRLRSRRLRLLSALSEIMRLKQGLKVTYTRGGTCSFNLPKRRRTSALLTGIFPQGPAKPPTPPPSRSSHLYSGEAKGGKEHDLLVQLTRAKQPASPELGVWRAARVLDSGLLAGARQKRLRSQTKYQDFDTKSTGFYFQRAAKQCVCGPGTMGITITPLLEPKRVTPGCTMPQCFAIRGHASWTLSWTTTCTIRDRLRYKYGTGL